MVLIVGMGEVGKEIAKYFGFDKVCYFDDQCEFEHIKKFDSWDDVHLVVKSHGISFEHDIIKEAIKNNIKITSDIEIFLNSRNGIKIGVTGTYGKSSFCALLHHVLGDGAPLCGNFGKSPINMLENKYFIIELSSYQLEALDSDVLKKLDIGVLLNVMPHHLDRHGSFEEYKAQKEKVLNAKYILTGVECDHYPKSDLFKQDKYKKYWQIIMHLFKWYDLNTSTAYMLAEKFKPLDYRTQIIYEDPLIVNDSKSTGCEASLHAIENVQGDCCWIVGGYGSNDWSVLASVEHKVKKTFVIENSANEVVPFLEKFDMDYIVVKNLCDAVKESMEYIKNNNVALLFSPGYQSFDEFENFEQRGAKFNEYIEMFKFF